MKILKSIESGLIVFEDFSNLPNIQSPLIDDANYDTGVGFINMNSGSIYLNSNDYPTLVFIVDNDFFPTTSTDVGGIAVRRGSENRLFYEYHDEVINEGVVQHAKVVKQGDVYTGYYSNDGINWVDQGYVVFPYVESIGVSISSQTQYKLNSIKVYKSESITIAQLFPNWRIEVYDGSNTLLVDEPINDGDISFQLPNYPFTGTFKIYDETDTLITDQVLTDVWGGDRYICTVNVEVLDNTEVPLTYDIARHLGTLDGLELEDWFILRNYDPVAVDLTLSIADYSPFGDWVTLAPNDNGIPGTYADEITVTVPGSSDVYFWIRVYKDLEFIDQTINYRETECLFYLLVE